MVLTCESVMVPISYGWMIVIVRGRPVVVIWVVVPDVFVDVKKRRHGRRDDQGLNEDECDEPAHGNSLLRPAEGRFGGDLLYADDERPHRHW
jgi:hypothetical protein